MPFETINNLSADTTNLLKEGIKKKGKKDYYEGMRNKSVITGFIVLSILVISIYIEGIVSTPDPFLALSKMLSNKFHLTLILVAAVLFGYFFYFQKKFKKEKDKLNNLRKEIIDHLNDTTNINLQDKAPIIKEEMKEKYDINLYIKNK
ncbi:DUF2663 family protein [Ornithinibacillus halotolerans]|uniref:DUF2663 family protein n=1 Tax=Ornithinibacillus halotolerans TaxID=1274357 RepID=A0A916S752_9BACI|nr:DUF2663 family protein [Ornithinibacillus halotolerans]GGA87451.1 hypothetical protein GCM10008025_32820 [Ornithinibacillus halotolerans]